MGVNFTPIEPGDLFLATRRRSWTTPKQWAWRATALILWAAAIMYASGMSEWTARLADRVWSVPDQVLSDAFWNEKRFFLMLAITWVYWIVRGSLAESCGLALYVVLAPVMVLSLLLRRGINDDWSSQYLVESESFTTPHSGLGRQRDKSTWRVLRTISARTLLFITTLWTVLTWDAHGYTILLVGLTFGIASFASSVYTCFQALAPKQTNRASRLNHGIFLAVMAAYSFAQFLWHRFERSPHGPAMSYLKTRRKLLYGLGRVLRSWYLANKRCDLQIASGFVLIDQIRRAAVLACSAVLWQVAWLRFVMGPANVDSHAAFLLSVSSIFPGSVEVGGQHPGLLVAAALAITGGFVFALWVALFVQVFIEARTRRLEELQKNRNLVRKMALDTGKQLRSMDLVIQRFAEITRGPSRAS